jgi:diguanylate cyclase (GGDEF)-like protein
MQQANAQSGDGPSIEAENIDEALIHRARNDLIFRTQGTAIFTICVVVLAFAYIIREDVASVPLSIWTFVCILTYLLRYLIYRSYIRAEDTAKSSSHWQTIFSSATGISGLCWGMSMFVTFPEDSINHQLLQILLLVIISAATTVTHSAYRWAGIAFSIASLLPAAIKLFMLQEDGYSQLGFFLLLFIFVMFSSAKYLNEIANRMFMLSYENSSLIQELKTTNSTLKDKNLQLEETKQELSAANDSLQKLATTDALTNLTNRRKFEALVQVKWQRCVESSTPISLMLVNIDMFKQYNDFYGQRKGDSCMVMLSDLLSSMPEVNRKGDCLARYSGDEFAVLLVDADANYAKSIAEKIRRDVELLRISRAEMPHELSPWVTVSIGVATEAEFSECSYDELLTKVDRALFEAKRRGRNTVVSAEQSSATQSS